MYVCMDGRIIQNTDGKNGKKKSKIHKSINCPGHHCSVSRTVMCRVWRKQRFEEYREDISEAFGYMIERIIS